MADSTALFPNRTVPVEAGSWTIDAAHSLVEFGVRHMTIARVTGRFTQVEGTVSVLAEEQAPTVDVTIFTESIASGHPKRDELIRSSDFLDVERFATMHFEGRDFRRIGDGDWELPGALTIKGVTRPVVLLTRFGGSVTHRGATRAGFSASTQINRKDFGVAWSATLDAGGAVVADVVEITIQVELVLLSD